MDTEPTSDTTPGSDTVAAVSTATAMPPDIKHPDNYINRELSLIEFNRRVLAQALDETVPLLERLRFLGICSTNLDEFFEVRVAGLKQQIRYAVNQTAPDHLSPQHTFTQIARTVHELVAEQYRILNEILIPQLEAEKIRIIRRTKWSDKQSAWIKRFFHDELLPVLTPIGLDPAHPFPRILNKSLNFIVALEGKDAFGRDCGLAVVQAPRALPRIIRLPKDLDGGDHAFVLLSSVIHAHVSDLFAGMTSKGCYQFRVTRNSDLFVDAEEVDDLLRAVEGELSSRHYGDSVRLEVADNCPDDIALFLLKQFQLSAEDLYQVNGLVNLNRLVAIYNDVDRPDLKYPAFTPAVPTRLGGDRNFFEALQAEPLILHLPFESFSPVVEFIRQAANDPQVLAIKQTLYRTGPESAIVKALLDAARAGKEVTVVIELRARFDEQANIELANQLQRAGAHVVYGVVGYKTHAKMALIVRREGKKLRRYVHLGTGNYHTATSRFYTDFGMFFCDDDIGEDVHKLFQQLTGLGRASKLKKLLQAPFTLHKAMLEHIKRESDNARAGKPAHIIAKMNALVEPQIIQALYEASNAGVKIELIVRGVCCLRPGVLGVSENIQVRSIIGRFLEHSRIFYFLNDGAETVYLSSADWMDRNFFRRVEVCFPVEDKKCKDRVIKQGLQPYLHDNTQAWVLHTDGSYKRLKPGQQKPRTAQLMLLESAAT